MKYIELRDGALIFAKNQNGIEVKNIIDFGMSFLRDEFFIHGEIEKEIYIFLSFKNLEISNEDDAKFIIINGKDKFDSDKTYYFQLTSQIIEKIKGDLDFFHILSNLRK